jgi:integration host factor subunit beta
MTKSELIEKVADIIPSKRKRDAEVIINSIFDSMVDALATGDRIEIRGFGSFHIRDRRARVGRNPKSGDKVDVDEKRVPFFKAGKSLKKQVDEGVKKYPIVS